MATVAQNPRTALASWSRRIAFFSASVILIALVLHRLGRMDTPLAAGLLVTALTGAGVALLLGIGAAVVIWRRGAAGAWSTAAGVAVSLAIFAWPASVAPFYLKMPHLNDVTTDTEHPPEFAAHGRERAKGANPVAYPGASYVARQAQTYPQLRAMVVDRPVDEVFDAVGEAARHLHWRIVAEEPPEKGHASGHIEAEDRTLILGFVDDVVVRVENEAGQTRIDMRSLSRYGRYDFGRNAQRVRDFYTELHARLEASVPNAGAPRGKAKARGTKLPVRSRRGAQDQKSGPRSGPGPARPDARRAPQQRATRP
ncbi:MAG: DUF1499 domain-containing protein [Hyphomicrobiaceae bacterium]